MIRPVIPFNLNKLQARVLIALARITWILAGRGTGKTQGITAPWILHKVEAMPGSCGAIIGQSFADLESKILKPLFTGFQMLGHKKDEHYIYGTKPPDSWDKPLIPIIDFKHVISFPNGTTIQLVSLHQKGSANSNSFQWMVGPEAKFFNPDQMQEIIPTLRGLVKEFGDSPWYGAMLFETDKYHPNIHWILEKRKLHNEALMNTVIYYQLKVNELQQKQTEVGEEMGKKIAAQIRKLNKLLSELRKKLFIVVESSAIDNIANLKEDYFENMRKSLTEYEYRVAIDNEDPTKVEGGYYPDRNERHLYRSELDETDKPLAIALDYQATIVPIVSCQLQEDTNGVETLRYLKDFYVKHPYKISDVVQKFCEYHKDRKCKTVYYFYDHTAKGESSNSKAPYEDVVDAFEKQGWNIIEIYMGQAPGHDEKYRFFSEVFKEEDLMMPVVRYHEEDCAATVLSMDSTPLKQTYGVEKDKSSERDKKIPQERATHLGDTQDMLMWAILKLKLYPTGSGVSTGEMAWR